MATIRINKTQNYTVMSNYHFKEKTMSLKAKGLLSLMLSLPDDWDYSVAGLVAICKENETAIKSTLKELQEFGYLQITKLMPSKDENRARIQYIYDIFEQPQESKKQEVENLPLENQQVENPVQLNTNKLNTNKLSTKEIYKESSKNEQSDFISLIDEFTPNEELRSELKEHLRTRKNKKAALTKRAIELSLQRLREFGKNEKEQIKIVQTAIMNGWTTFYPLTDKYNKNNTHRGNEGLEVSYDIDAYERDFGFDV